MTLANQKRWASLTDDEKRRQRDAQKKGWTSLTPEQKNKYSKVRKEQHANRPYEEKLEFSRKMSLVSRRIWENCSEERKRLWGEKISEAKKIWHANRTDEQKRDFSEVMKTWHLSLTKEERQKRNTSISKGTRAQWASLNDEQKHRINEAKKNGTGKSRRRQ
jgi:hypothetical protein